MTRNSEAVGPAARADALRRLDRVAGQARAVRNMVEDGRASADVLSGIQALKGALDAVEALVLADHIDALYAVGSGTDPCEARTAEDRLKSLRETLRHHVGGR